MTGLCGNTNRPGVDLPRLYALYFTNKRRDLSMIIYDYFLSGILITLSLMVLLATIVMILYVLIHDARGERGTEDAAPQTAAEEDDEEQEWEAI